MQEIDKARAATRKAEKEAEMWRKIATLAFTMHPKCLDGCRRGLMCNCGYMLYASYLQAAEQGSI